MEKKIKEDDTITCIGEYNSEDGICKLCAVRLTCFLEKEIDIKMEDIQDMLLSEMSPIN